MIARRELVDEALAVGVVQRRALAAHGLGDEEALAARDPGDRGRVELDELEVGERRARRARQQQARSRTSPAGWWCATTARRRRRWRARRRAPPRSSAVVGVEAGAAAVEVEAQRRRAAPLEHLDARVLGDHRGELAQDPAPRRAPARVRDAAARVPALEPEREVAVAVGVEAHAERLEVAEALGRLGAQDARGAAAHDAAARLQRVLLVLLGRVVAGQRRGEPALRPVGRRLGERARGDERDAGALARGGQGGVEAGGAGAHDDEVGPLHGKPYGTRVPRTVWLRHELSLAHDVPGHPERPARIVALEAAMERAGLVRLRAPGGARGLAGRPARGPPGAPHPLHRRAERRRRRPRRHGHDRRRGDLRGGAARGRRRAWRSSTRC